MDLRYCRLNYGYVCLLSKEYIFLFSVCDMNCIPNVKCRYFIWMFIQVLGTFDNLVGNILSSASLNSWNSLPRNWHCLGYGFNCPDFFYIFLWARRIKLRLGIVAWGIIFVFSELPSHGAHHLKGQSGYVFKKKKKQNFN